MYLLLDTLKKNILCWQSMLSFKREYIQWLIRRETPMDVIDYFFNECIGKCGFVGLKNTKSGQNQPLLCSFHVRRRTGKHGLFNTFNQSEKGQWQWKEENESGNICLDQGHMAVFHIARLFIMSDEHCIVVYEEQLACSIFSVGATHITSKRRNRFISDV